MSLGSLLWGRVGMIHSHLPSRQWSHQEVKSLPDIKQALAGQLGIGARAPCAQSHAGPLAFLLSTP